MQFSTVSRLLLAVFVMAFAMPSHAIDKLTDSQIESGMNAQIDLMTKNGAFTYLATCSGKSETTIIKGFRNFLYKCAKKIDIQIKDDNQYDICIENGIKSVLEMTDAQLNACYTQFGDEDEQDPYDDELEH